jgi:hypothetical protein
LAVSVTVFAPKVLQLKELSETLAAFTVPQLSLEAAAFRTWLAVILAALPLKFTEIFWQTTVGTVLSCTVTVALQVALNPLLPTTVSTTVFVPMLAQVSVVGETFIEAMPPTAVEPPFTLAGVMVTLPLAPSTAVYGWQTALGRLVLVTVTMAVQLAVRLLLSVTVSVTVFGPMLLVVNELGVTERLAMPQLSDEPPSTWAPVIEALPLPSRFTVMFWQTAPGLVASVTVTVAVQVEVRLLLSVTVNVTGFAPTFAQVKEVVESAKLAMPQLSEEPLSICAGVTEAMPLALRFTDTF